MPVAAVMLIAIPDVLTAEQVAAGARSCSTRPTGSTARSPPARSRRGPRTTCSSPKSHPVARELGDLILGALQRNPLFISAALPLHVFPPLFNRYQGGQSFGSHVDNAIRQVTGTPHRIRTDLSATLFFTDPDEYDGGELVVEDTYGVHSVKLPAGHLVLYPSTSLHSRAAGHARRARRSFFWIQSMVRDDGQRTLLFDLDIAIQRIGRDLPDHPAAVQLTGVYHNLLRRWADA